MKKTFIYFNAVLVWTLFLIPSTAQTSTETISARERTFRLRTSVNPSSLETRCPPQDSNLGSSAPKKVVATPKKPPSAVWQDLRSHDLNRQFSSSQQRNPHSFVPSKKYNDHARPTSEADIVEAQGWTRDPEGKILLTARVSNKKVQMPNQPDAGC